MAVSDELFAPLARVLGRVLAKVSDCGLNCPVSELGWADYLFLALLLAAVFVLTRKALNRRRERR